MSSPFDVITHSPIMQLANLARAGQNPIADYVKAIAPLTGEKPTELQRAHIRQQKVAAQEQPEQEAPQDKDTFSIYQIKGGDETRDLRFEPYDRLTATGHRVDAKNYALAYSAELTPGTSLEDIYTRFNIDHPKDFKGHSLSLIHIYAVRRRYSRHEHRAHYRSGRLRRTGGKCR